MKSIGLVGTNGAGKSVVCDYLKEKGFDVLSLSDVVREEATNRGLEHTRDNMVMIANELKSKQGLNVLAIKVFEMAQKKGFQKVVFDSIRNIEEVQYLKKLGTEILGIDAPVEIRYQRISSRKRASDNIDFETFVQHDERENKGLSSGQNIYQAFKECREIIQNKGDLNELHQHMDALLTQIPA